MICLKTANEKCCPSRVESYWCPYTFKGTLNTVVRPTDVKVIKGELLLTRALDVSMRGPMVRIIWHRHSRSSDISLSCAFFFFSNNCLMHLCRMLSCNIWSLPSSPETRKFYTMHNAVIIMPKCSLTNSKSNLA